MLTALAVEADVLVEQERGRSESGVLDSPTLSRREDGARPKYYCYPPYIAAALKKYFRKKLLDWNEQSNRRKMPWKGIKNPYRIWLSEIILQQTRVEQGTAYYEKFVKAFPKVQGLAAASEDRVMKLWEGLGYYSRARNLHAAAQYVAHDLGGKFPDSYDEILKMKGVGPYTAAAIASFAFNEARAVVDGNVYRVLSRFFDLPAAIDSTAGKKQFAALAQELIHPKRAAHYNQAIMDFGATICTPAKPLCASCPFKRKCLALSNDTVATRPVKEKKLKKRLRYFYFFLPHNDPFVYLEKREAKDIWQRLYQLPLLETSALCSEPALLQEMMNTGFRKNVRICDQSKVYKHVLTHQTIFAQFVSIKAGSFGSKRLKTLIKVPFERLNDYAYPRLIDCYFREKRIYLE